MWTIYPLLPASVVITVLFYSVKVAATIEKSVNEDLDLIGSWLYNN